MTSVTMTVNEYDVPMLEIKTEKRPVYISVKKAIAIISTNDNPKLITTVNKYGRELFKVDYGNGKSFTVGQNKMEIVLDNVSTIEEAIA